MEKIPVLPGRIYTTPFDYHGVVEVLDINPDDPEHSKPVARVRYVFDWQYKKCGDIAHFLVSDLGDARAHLLNLTDYYQKGEDDLPLLHEMKCWPKYFEAVKENRKNFELRKLDRATAIREGDFLRLSAWEPQKQEYTGQSLIRRISYLLHGPEGEAFGLQPGYGILGLAPVIGQLIHTISNNWLEVVP